MKDRTNNGLKSSEYDDLLILDRKPHGLPSLQSICRRCIMRVVGIDRVQQMDSLPIPRLVKEYLQTFTIPGDFNLEGIYMDYHFSFMRHRHSTKHQVHPGEFLIDGTHVLIKSLNTVADKDNLSACEKERDIWKSTRHRGLMNCFFGLLNIGSSRLCYVLEFPVVDLQEIVLKCYIARYEIPEYLIWFSLFKISEVLLYLTSLDIDCTDLCYSKHIVVDAAGRLKLENKLLYLPDPEIRDPISVLLMAPEEKLGISWAKTMSWKIGLVVRELMSTEFTPIVPKNALPIVGVPYYRSLGILDKKPVNYSVRLKELTERCQETYEHKRPSLIQLETDARYSVNRLAKCYEGPQNFLQLEHVREAYLPCHI